ncbi:hypothetical protein PUN28_016907 [Cardiocondyla obscurior]|uniref:Uncharacterized protein n=1 Tax=Cardiocondyla obscurior TaxID=286306 RepID=A0AAW2ERN2_9HYME
MLTNAKYNGGIPNTVPWLSPRAGLAKSVRTSPMTPRPVVSRPPHNRDLGAMSGLSPSPLSPGSPALSLFRYKKALPELGRTILDSLASEHHLRNRSSNLHWSRALCLNQEILGLIPTRTSNYRTVGTTSSRGGVNSVSSENSRILAIGICYSN